MAKPPRSTEGRDPRVGTMRAPGFPCPECGTPIVVEALALIAAGSIQCARCGLQLTIQQEESAPAIDALSTYMDEFERVKGGLPDLDPTNTDRAPRRRGRAPARRSRERTRSRNR